MVDGVLVRRDHRLPDRGGDGRQRRADLRRDLRGDRGRRADARVRLARQQRHARIRWGVRRRVRARRPHGVGRDPRLRHPLARVVAGLGRTGEVRHGKTKTTSRGGPAGSGARHRPRWASQPRRPPVPRR